MAKFRVGDRVKVVRGEYARQLAKWDTGIGTVVTVSDRWVSIESGEYSNMYPPQDLELVTTNGEEQRMGRRTFRQLQESVTVKKDALWQEACDDGDQEYILLDQSFNKDSRNTQKIYDRSLVEEDSKHFVQVFEVQPQYMTRDELDKWEAFKGRKKPGRKPGVVTPAKRQYVKSGKYSKKAS